MVFRLDPKKFSEYTPESSVDGDEIIPIVKDGENSAVTIATIQGSIPESPVQSVNGQTGDVVLDKSDVGLSNVDNTSDANKPISTAAQTALNLKAVDANVVHNTGNETIAGIKTFSSSPIVPTPTTATQVANKSYVDAEIATIEASDVDSVNGATGTVVLDQDDILDGTTYKQYSQTEKTKLAGIEALADVTDTANVTAAGALMDSEVDADIKTLSLPASTTISTFGASLVDDADATAARTTLGITAGGSGDIWVEKAGDTMTGNLSIAANTALSGLSVSNTVSGVGAFFTTVSPDNIVGIGSTTAHDVHIVADSSTKIRLYAAGGVEILDNLAVAGKISGVTDPTLAQDVATKNYVDVQIATVEGSDVDSFNGRTGVVVPVAGDYTATQTTNTPAGNIAATNVQTAINELDTEKVAKSGDTMTGALVNTLASGNSIVVDTNTFVVDATNNRVGVGTASPLAKLEVTDAIKNPAGGLSSFVVGGTAYQTLFSSNGWFSGNATWNVIDAALPGWRFDLASASNASLDKFTIYHRSAAAAANSWNAFFTIDSGGKVGVLTAVPTHSVTLGSTSTGEAFYNTADQTTNYERMRQYWASNVYTIGNEFGGSAVTRELRVGIAGSPGGSVNRYLSVKGTMPFFTYAFSTSLTGYGVDIGGGQVLSASSGTQGALSLTPAITQTSTAGYTALLINPTESTTGSGAKLLLDAQVAGTSKFKVDNTGAITVSSNVSTAAILNNTSAPSSIGGSGVITRTSSETLADGDRLGFVIMGGSTTNAAGIVAYAGSTWSGSDKSSYITFETVAAGSTTRTEKVRISTEGYIGINVTSIPSRLSLPASTSTVGGIAFGTDTNLYRSAADTLKTDDTFIPAGGINLTTANIVTDTTTGTKIGTATSQKISLWNATPIVQPTTAVAAATFVANTSGIVNDTATWDGYTMGQIVKALRNMGALA